MLTTTKAISIFRRNMILATFVQMGLWGVVLASLFLNVLPIGPVGSGTVLMIVAICIFVSFAFYIVKAAGLESRSLALINSRQFKEAEANIEILLHRSLLIKTRSIANLYHLMLLRHSEKSWPDVVELSAILVNQKSFARTPFYRSMLLVRTEAMLETGNLNGAYSALIKLYEMRLSLVEATNLLVLQLDYESRIGAWESMLPANATYKRVQLAELLPSLKAARAQGLMALAAQKLGRSDWCQWLTRRAHLLVGHGDLIADRPILAELSNS